MTLLKGLKILDFSTLLPGPYATMMLADLGAEVLRVESATRPDLLRDGVPRDGKDSVNHGYINRSKKSITLDLKKADAIEIIKKLVLEYDIVLEQFRPGVMERLGLGYDTLKEVNPKLIYCSITGYGQTGPYRNRPGHDNNYLSISGIASYSGRQKGGPAPTGIQIADVAGGSLHGIIGILSAVIYRGRTGEGQWIDISMTDCSFALNATVAAGYLMGGINPELEKTMLNGGTFYDYYETKDGRYFSVGSIEPKFRKLLCEGIGRTDLLELSFSEKPDDIHAFKKEVQTAFLEKTFTQWQTIFGKIEACVEPVLTFAEACEHPQIAGRGMIVEVPKSNRGYQKQIACPIKSTVFKPEYKHIGVELGENNKEILIPLEQLQK
ncbi:CaiB/BaiF CoA-transferase family protein [Bacillus sp. AFS055030]|uniref:CaiB/BaiF CoA transferase family protein n=1 Tax=Bacillus sp. AFS055030 TaxID=2033507 RepID=UPI000BFB780F|nr:CaiB/BaiF CoA-transferase family protein [Bacillus sp. AFS055030]PGL70232.1 carnitine dehydratase [Bacillus sp. AFS055030]